MADEAAMPREFAANPDEESIHRPKRGSSKLRMRAKLA
jgi:hypothetical protein